ncbi:ANTAR domain-containing protein [Amycolatopsis sp. NPDC050768]|uniref:ANTAR domain-containing protein n=1 Tax=unclassified Amycolatopsis TaxID=2618356 RepID=UPI001C69F698|nr:ANTAR domain-containing protein [Amycolatopsis sp. DSM 110486]
MHCTTGDAQRPSRTSTSQDFRDIRGRLSDEFTLLPQSLEGDHRRGKLFERLDNTLGAQNLCAAQVDAFSDRTEQYRRVFATHAAVALVGAQTEAQLHVAIESRDVIGMAKGILMQRHDIDAVQAFRLLVESSQTTKVTLHDVAT